MSQDDSVFFKLPLSSDIESETDTENIFAMPQRRDSGPIGWERYQFSMSSDDDDDDEDQEEADGEDHSHLFAGYTFEQDAFGERIESTNTLSIVKTLSSSLPRVLSPDAGSAITDTTSAMSKTKSTGHLTTSGSDRSSTSEWLCTDRNKLSRQNNRPQRIAPKPLPPPPPPPLPAVASAVIGAAVPNQVAPLDPEHRHNSFSRPLSDLCASQSDRRKQYAASLEMFLRETQDYQRHTIDKRLRKEIGDLLQALFVVRDHIEGRESPPPPPPASTRRQLQPAVITPNSNRQVKDDAHTHSSGPGETKDIGVTKGKSKNAKNQDKKTRDRDRERKQKQEKQKSRRDRKSAGDAPTEENRPSSLPASVSPIHLLSDFVPRSAPLSPRGSRSPRSRSPHRSNNRFKPRSSSERNLSKERAPFSAYLHRSSGASDSSSACKEERDCTKTGENRMSKRNSRDRTNREKTDCAIDEIKKEHERLIAVPEKDWKMVCRLLAAHRDGGGGD